MFKIPIIKVKSIGENNTTHIVGTDPHDKLYIDTYTGGIHYHNIQCCASTQKVFNDGEDPDYGFEFQGEEGYFYDTEIEFVTPEQLIELIMETTKMQAEQKIKLSEIAQKMFEDKELWEEKATKAMEENGIVIL